jgi:hypothetical protein
MNNDSRYLYIPLEIFIRELKGMLLLSLVAAQYGWKVVLGGKQAIFPVLDKLPSGVALLKSVVPGEIKLQKEIISYGHKIVSLDVEGLLPSNGKSGVELRYSKDTIALSDILFFWGKEQFESVERLFPDIKKDAQFNIQEFFYPQVYSLDNHLSWLKFERIKNYSRFTDLFSPETLLSYKRDLIEKKVTDVIGVIFKKCDSML